MLERTDRVWVSDCIDPLDRQQMNRWTMQLLPPELLGSHIASGVSHSTGRWHELSFRAGTALFGHLGIEWDLARATDAENRDLAGWIALYKEHRQLMHAGDLVRVDEADPSLLVYGSVAADAMPSRVCPNGQKSSTTHRAHAGSRQKQTCWPWSISTSWLS